MNCVNYLHFSTDVQVVFWSVSVDCPFYSRAVQRNLIMTYSFLSACTFGAEIRLHSFSEYGTGMDLDKINVNMGIGLLMRTYSKGKA